MKFIRLFTIFFLVTFCVFSYAQENKYIFIGKNGNENTFALEFIGNDIENHMQISEKGEIYIKVDRIFAIPKETLSNFSFFSALGNSGNACAPLNALTKNISDDSQVFYVSEGNIMECCTVSEQAKKWKCPYCGHWWNIGEECKYDECPTNQWKKKKQGES